jgi:hypothetical protein
MWWASTALPAALAAKPGAVVDMAAYVCQRPGNACPNDLPLGVQRHSVVTLPAIRTDQLLGRCSCCSPCIVHIAHYFSLLLPADTISLQQSSSVGGSTLCSIMHGLPPCKGWRFAALNSLLLAGPGSCQRGSTPNLVHAAHLPDALTVAVVHSGCSSILGLALCSHSCRDAAFVVDTAYCIMRILRTMVAD